MVSNSTTPPAKPTFTPLYARLYISALLIVMVVTLGLIFIAHIASTGYDREVHNWEVKLNLIADSRLADVNGWVQTQFNEMRGLAENPSLQLYMSELNELVKADETALERQSPLDSPTQQVYLRHLLTITGERGGFTPKDPAVNVPAGVDRTGRGGIAVVTRDGKVLVATSKMPPVEGALLEFVQKTPSGEPVLRDIHLSADGRLNIGFMVPVFLIQGESKPSDQIGWVLGVRQVDDTLFAKLKHPGSIEASLEVELVRRDGEGVTYISPLADGSPAMKKHISMPKDVEDDQALAEGFAIAKPGAFAIRPDYARNPVLVVGRQVANTPWTLVAKVDKDEALSVASNARMALGYQLFWALIAVVAAMVAAWRHGTSRSAMNLSRRLKKTLKAARSREALLSVVTNSQPGAIYITDDKHTCWFGNESMAKQTGVPAKNLVGKPLQHLLGPALAEQLNERSDAALAAWEPVSWTLREKDELSDAGERVLRYRHIPVAPLPVDAAGENQPGVLVIQQDITTVMQDRERANRTLSGLINTLVAMVDQRDPYAANHSQMVATIAREVAVEMNLDEQLVQTAELAGTIMNIGKMVVPSEWLTKAGALNEKEREAIRDSLYASADMIEGVEFDGPVANTLRQSLERWDGSGPEKFRGEDILITARIIAAANAFVGMVSPRAYRQAISVDEALRTIVKGMDKEFDRKVILAMANYIDNHGGRDMIVELTKGPKAA